MENSQKLHTAAEALYGKSLTHLYLTQDEHLDFGVFCEKLKLTQRSVGSLIVFNCTIKYSKCRINHCYTFN